MTTPSEPLVRAPEHTQAFRDADACMSMVKPLFKEAGVTPTPEAVARVFHTLMGHVITTRRLGGK